MYARIIFHDFKQGLINELKHYIPDQARCAFGTAMAALVAVLLANWLNLDNPYWAGITALVVSRSSYASSLVKGVLRVIGTIGGCFLALILMGTFIDNVYAILCIIFFVSIATVLISSTRGKDNYAWSMGGFMVVLISIAGLVIPNGLYNFAFYRTFEITMGTAIAVIMSAIFNPVTPSQTYIKKTADVWHSLAEIIRLTAQGWEFKQYETKKILEHIKQTETILEQLPGLVFEGRMEGGISTENETKFFKIHHIATRFSKNLFMYIKRRPCLLDGYSALFKNETIEIATQLDKMSLAIEQTLSSSKNATNIAKAAHELDTAVQALVKKYQEGILSGIHENHSVEARLSWVEFQYMLNNLSKSFLNPNNFTQTYSKRKGIPQQQEKILIKQAVSLGLAMVSVPLIWKWFDLPGALQIGVTSLILLTPDPVETWRKGILRLIGCLTGGSLGLLLLGTFVGHHLATWALAYWILIFFFSYLEHGDQRCSYSGLQGGIALTMTLVQGLGPSTELQPPITRLCGILMGFALWNIIHSLLDKQDSELDLRAQLEEMYALISAALISTDKNEKELIVIQVDRSLNNARQTQDLLIWQEHITSEETTISQEILISIEQIIDEIKQMLHINENPEYLSILSSSEIRLPGLLNESGKILRSPFPWPALLNSLSNIEDHFENDFKTIHKSIENLKIDHPEQLEIAEMLMSTKTMLQSLSSIAINEIEMEKLSPAENHLSRA